MSAELMTAIRLTRYSHGAGWACKLGPAELAQVLRHVPAATDPRILVDAATRDDAAVFRFTAYRAIVATVDFFTPIVDDAYDFGRIAAANAFSDVYAMGATPLLAPAVAAMTRLNAAAARAMLAVGVHAATDVTGFGLLGHLRSLLEASGAAAEVTAHAVPLLPHARDMAARGAVPGGTQRNLT